MLGIVGLGRIGSAMALRGKSLGMDVAYFDPYKADGYDKVLGIRRVETLPELLAQSLVVSLHCPLTEETRHLIDAAALAVMPRGSYLVNTSRGAVVDCRAIPAALASGHLAGAAIDVLEQEPPPEDDVLLAAWRDPRHAALTGSSSRRTWPDIAKTAGPKSPQERRNLPSGPLGPAAAECRQLIGTTGMSGLQTRKGQPP